MAQGARSSCSTSGCIGPDAAADVREVIVGRPRRTRHANFRTGRFLKVMTK